MILRVEPIINCSAVKVCKRLVVVGIMVGRDRGGVIGVDCSDFDAIVRITRSGR